MHLYHLTLQGPTAIHQAVYGTSARGGARHAARALRGRPLTQRAPLAPDREL